MPSVSASSHDRYYGYGPISAVCTSAITALFSPAAPAPPSSAAPASSAAFGQHGYPSPPPSAGSSPQIGGAPSSASPAAQWKPREGIDTPPQSPVVAPNASPDVPELMDFVAYALYRTRLPTPIVHSALLLLTRLKKLYPSARGTSSSPHRLFLSALMLASKMSMDDTYSNRSWCIVGQQLFTLPEVNRMERELFGFLNCNCCVSEEELDAWATEWLAPGGIIGPNPTILRSSGASERKGSGCEERKRRRSTAARGSPLSPSVTSAMAAEERQRAASAAANALLNYTSSRRSASPSRPTAVRSSSQPAPVSPDCPSASSHADESFRHSHSHHQPSHRSLSHFRQHASSGAVSLTHSSLRNQASDSSMRSTSSGGSSEADRLPASACGSAASVGSSPASVAGPWTPEFGVGAAIAGVQGEGKRREPWLRASGEVVGGARWSSEG